MLPTPSVAGRTAPTPRTPWAEWGATSAAAALTTLSLLSLAAPPAAAATAAAAPPAAAAAAAAKAGYAFARPDALAASGHTLLVANGVGNSVTLLDTTTGKLLAVLSGPRYGFRAPSAMAVVGGVAFVANEGASSVTELSVATRAVVRVIGGAAAGISRPISIAAVGGKVFVLSASGSVTKLDASTGAVLGEVKGLGSVAGIATAGGRLFVTEPKANAVAEIDATTLARLADASQPGRAAPAFATPVGIAALGSDVWVTNESGRTLTEIAAPTGHVVRVVPNMSGYLPSPVAITAGDGRLFVASPPGSSPMVTQVEAGTHVTMPWMMCNTNAAYTFSNPDAMAVVGADLWVANAGGAGGPAGNSVTEMNARSGKLVVVLR